MKLWKRYNTRLVLARRYGAGKRKEDTLSVLAKENNEEKERKERRQVKKQQTRTQQAVSPGRR